MAVSAQYFTNSGNRFTDNGRVRDTRNTHYDTRVTQPGRARQYAGTAQNHQYTKLSSTPALPSSGDWSVSGWFCVDSFPTSGTYGTLLSQFSQESGQGFTLQVDSNKKLRLYYSGTTTVSATGTTELKAGKWYFVAMNASVLSDYRIVSLKVDGLVDIGIAVLESAYSMTQTPTVLGAEGNPASTMGQFLQGKLWNWCIWAGKALSNSQIANLYLHPTTLLETGYLTRCYKLEESSVGVTSAYDCGSDIKHGTHTGNPAIYSDASVPASFANEVGYSIIGSVIPRREYTGNTGYDALNGTALQFVGRATRHAKVNGVNALKFNGDGGYVDIGAVTGARTGSAKRTICCWVKPLAFGNDEALPILQYSSTSGNGKKMIIYAENSSTFSKKSFSVGCGGHRVVANDSDLSVGTWYHVAVTFPANTSMSSGIEIFINGKNANASTEDGSPVALSTGTVDIKLAADMLGATTGNCVLSDVRIYNEDLGSDMDSYGDSANIAKVMYGELHLVSNLKGAWPLAEGSGDELYEIVGGAHGATDTTATSGAGTEYPVWDIGDGIPSYNLRYGHSKALLMEDSDEYVSSRRIYDLDKYTSWTFSLHRLPRCAYTQCLLRAPGASPLSSTRSQES